MGHWDEIRRRARAEREAVLVEAGGNPAASALLDAADRLTGFNRVGLPAGDALLDGGEAALDFDMERIWFNREIDAATAAFYQAHEYAHLWLHGTSVDCYNGDIDPDAIEEAASMGSQRVDGYGPDERREREANVFAREFLAPTTALREWYVAGSMSVKAIEDRTGVSSTLILRQLSRALLTPEIADTAITEPDIPERPLDPSQEAAAHTPRGPLLVEAGPGTGKTRTLVGRIDFLLDEGVSPSAILALTFSNRAAEELRNRIGVSQPAAALEMWLGTIHAFGLELLRKHGVRLGLPSRPMVIDPAEAIDLLEDSLADLELDHYENLYEPALNLRDILGAISRAKDELVGPLEYMELAQRMRANARSEEEVESAEKAVEVARVYGIYQALLDRDHLLDFGDLICKTVVLLRTEPEVKEEVARAYPHVLVDEYQDVNRASGLLIRELVGAGAGLWVVGDARQSIYRFRGAAPANMRLFPADFPGAKIMSLRRNYRSQPAILNVVAAFAPTMKAVDDGSRFVPWQPVRPAAGGQVSLRMAADLESEAQGLAREIERNREAGIPYREQAILCRSHTYLARFAGRLEDAGTPVLYLGNLFERSEVRDLLALLSLSCERDGRGLLRVARFPEYSIPLSDVRTMLSLASRQNMLFPQALQLAEDEETISQRGKHGFALLAEHLASVSYATHAWPALAHYLFESSNFIRSLLEDESVLARQQRFALYQFLQFAQELRLGNRHATQDPKRRFLEYVRRLEVFGEEKPLRQVPAWADSIDGVRLLTVHASKGLEFRAVYLPALATGLFPASRQAQPCPPPIGMLASSSLDHDEEEECLFFVALSRARDKLCLSRAQRYGRQNRSPSPLLATIAHVLPSSSEGSVDWASGAETPLPNLEPLPSNRRFSGSELDVYGRCPRQYFYEYVLDLSSSRGDSSYPRFYSCLQEVLAWVATELASGRRVTAEESISRLLETWDDRGPRDPAYATVYLRSAESILSKVAARVGSGKPLERPEWEIALGHGRVFFVPDNLEILPDGSHLVERLRTGRPTKSETDKDIYGLYAAAAQGGSMIRRPRVQLRYLSGGHTEPIELSQRRLTTRLNHYDEAIVGILREDFHAEPSDRTCPRCAHYFICPAAEDS